MIQQSVSQNPLTLLRVASFAAAMPFLLMAGCNSSPPPNPLKENKPSSADPNSQSKSQKKNAISSPAANSPEAVWNATRIGLLSGKIDEAVRHFSAASSEQYRKSFEAMGRDEIAATMNKTIKKAAIEGDKAQYFFQDVIDGQTITFPVTFVKENGVWKILEF